MKQHFAVLVVMSGAVGLVGCVGEEGATGAVGELSQAVGEPMNGYPTPEERLGIMAINRARSDPSTVRGPNSAMYPPRPPVLWGYDLSRSSRFHAINLQQSKANLMHTSPCKLNPNIGATNCTGAVACACIGPVGNACANCAGAAAINNCGTDPFTRMSYFGVQGSGEVAAAGYPDPFAVVDGWMDEAAGADGHRRNLTDQGVLSTVMGYGHAGAGGCWSTFDVSDSANVGGPAPPIPTAATKPARGGGNAAYRFYATWAYAPGAPQSIYVVVDGQCTAMQKEMGNVTLNSTWIADVTVGIGCHPWYILARSAQGGRFTYPTSGAVNLAAGGTCVEDYTAQAPAAACEAAPPPPPDLAMKAIVDFAFKPGTDLTGSKFDLSSGAGDDGGLDFTDDGGIVYRGPGAGGCGCGVAGGRSYRGWEALGVLLMGLGLSRRRWAARG